MGLMEQNNGPENTLFLARCYSNMALQVSLQLKKSLRIKSFISSLHS